jgi:hypothetical protein
MIEFQAVTDYGQIKEGDTLAIEKSNGCKFVATAKRIINPGTEKEEVVICKTRNDYFIVSMFLNGTSWVKNVTRLPDVELTSITNNMRTFVRC